MSIKAGVATALSIFALFGCDKVEKTSKAQQSPRVQQNPVNEVQVSLKMQEQQRDEKVQEIISSNIGFDVKHAVASGLNKQDIKFTKIAITGSGRPAKQGDRWVVPVEFNVEVDSLVIKQTASYQAKAVYNSDGQFLAIREATNVGSATDTTAIQNFFKD